MICDTPPFYIYATVAVPDMQEYETDALAKRASDMDDTARLLRHSCDARVGKYSICHRNSIVVLASQLWRKKGATVLPTGASNVQARGS
ncbi:MAG: hypothetical protein IJV08_02330 [Bacteroidaceae bacterium]|nr:hypothetical protein [Bacteroidaceae bacterium]